MVYYPKEVVVSMAVSKAQQRATQKYIKNNYDRLELRIPKGERESIKQHAEKMGESLNQFLIRAVQETMRRDG